MDPETIAAALGERGVAVRAGLHCAPLAHEAMGTGERGAVRASLGYASTAADVDALLRAVARIERGREA